MKLQLVFTLDYELFGDASGSVIHEQIKPTNNLLDIFDEYGAKLSLFFEYGQYLGYEKFASSTNSFEEDNQLICKQLIDCMQRGHDVQFHYHPTWYNAKYKKNKIHLDINKFDISTMSSDEIYEIVYSGKEFLDKLLTPININYTCHTFRAGAWSMKNPNLVLPIFKKLGFKCDSSVAPHAKFSSTYGEFDYSNASSSYGSWLIKSDSNSLVEKDINGDFLELAIYTKKSRFAFLKYFNSHYLKSNKIISEFYKTKVSELSMSRVDKLKKVLKRNYYMADFNTMSHKTLYKMVLDVIKENENTEKVIPLVFIGHSKSSYFNDELRLLFQKLSSLNCIEYKTLSEVVEENI